jgi:hypothetical protein
VDRAGEEPFASMWTATDARRRAEPLETHRLDLARRMTGPLVVLGTDPTRNAENRLGLVRTTG